MSETALSRGELVVRMIAQTAVDNETYFCELDAVVGDGDFGYSLARGFEVVARRLGLDGVHATSAGLLKKTAIVLTKRIGGTSGPIWGTAFLRAGGGADGRRPSPAASRSIAAMRAAIEGIKQRGNTDLGDKTLLDALVPAVDELEAALPEGAGRGDRTRCRRRRARAPRRRRGCSRSAAGPRTPASAAATRSTPARSAWR